MFGVFSQLNVNLVDFTVLQDCSHLFYHLSKIALCNYCFNLLSHWDNSKHFCGKCLIHNTYNIWCLVKFPQLIMSIERILLYCKVVIIYLSVFKFIVYWIMLLIVKVQIINYWWFIILFKSYFTTSWFIIVT